MLAHSLAAITIVRLAAPHEPADEDNPEEYEEAHPNTIGDIFCSRWRIDYTIHASAEMSLAGAAAMLGQVAANSPNFRAECRF